MECVAPSANTWRNWSKDWDDDAIERELNRAWAGRPHAGPPYDWTYHDWTNYRAATLRAARKRGLDISVTRLGT